LNFEVADTPIVSYIYQNGASGTAFNPLVFGGSHCIYIEPLTVVGTYPIQWKKCRDFDGLGWHQDLMSRRRFDG